MSTRLQIRGVDGIIVEAVPLLELLLGKRMRFGGVPFQHGVVEVKANRSTVLLEHARGVVQHVIGIKDTDLDTTGLRLDTLCVLLTADLGTNQARVLEVVEKTAKFVVSGFLGHERLELGPLDEGGDAASVIAWNGVLGVANEEGEVELLQDFLGHNGGVAWLRDGVLVRERRALRFRRWTAHRRSHSHAAIVVAVDILALLRRIFGREDRQPIRADATFEPLERRRDGCGLAVRREQIVSDVFDEDTFALLSVSILMHHDRCRFQNEDKQHRPCRLGEGPATFHRYVVVATIRACNDSGVQSQGEEQR